MADVFLLPSELESFGLSALEAMACGVPVVGSDAGGLPEVVKHTETGFLLPVGDIEGMAARTIEILKDDEHARELGQAGRRRAAVAVRRRARGQPVRAVLREGAGRRDRGRAFDIAGHLRPSRRRGAGHGRHAGPGGGAGDGASRSST